MSVKQYERAHAKKLQQDDQQPMVCNNVQVRQAESLARGNKHFAHALQFNHKCTEQTLRCTGNVKSDVSG